MAKGLKHGAGGGAPLNFKVVGGTSAPANPKANTIWVNTSNEITFYAFQPVTPSNPQNGWVWINVGTSSSVAFNALKKNRIQIYPIFAKQYINGAWENVDAMFYKNGEWVQFSFLSVVLYDSGTFNTAYATKLIAKGAKATSSSGSTNTAPTINYNSTNLSLNQATGWKAGIAYFENKIDLTNFNSVVLEVSGKNVDNGVGPTFYCWESVPTYFSTEAVVTKSCKTDNTKKTVTVDVSSLSGKYYLGFGLGSSDTETAKMNLYKATLE